MSPRPKTDRVARSIRLLRTDDAMLVAEAERRHMSIPDVIALAVRQLAETPIVVRPNGAAGWSAGTETVRDRRRDEVQPRFR